MSIIFLVHSNSILEKGEMHPITDVYTSEEIDINDIYLDNHSTITEIKNLEELNNVENDYHLYFINNKDEEIGKNYFEKIAAKEKIEKKLNNSMELIYKALKDTIDFEKVSVEEYEKIKDDNTYEETSRDGSSYDHWNTKVIIALDNFKLVRRAFESRHFFRGKPIDNNIQSFRCYYY